MQIKGVGIFGWSGSERRSDRYGTFCLADSGYDNNGTKKVSWTSLPAELEGQRCSIHVTVLEARASGHIGDFFRGIGPTKPEVGEVIDLGTGELFTEDKGYAMGVGLLPDDGRDSDWFDPRKLYRLHDQTVEVTITVE